MGGIAAIGSPEERGHHARQLLRLYVRREALREEAKRLGYQRVFDLMPLGPVYRNGKEVWRYVGR